MTGLVQNLEKNSRKITTFQENYKITRKIVEKLAH
jgi:hypothetical protein